MGRRPSKAERVKVHDAADLIASLERIADEGLGNTGAPDPSLGQIYDHWAGGSRVVLRVQVDFLEELVANTDMHVPLAAFGGLQHFPFGTIAVSFDRPWAVRLERYPDVTIRHKGFMMAGTRFIADPQHRPTSEWNRHKYDQVLIGSMEGAASIRSVWACTSDSRWQHNTGTIRVENLSPEMTLAEVVASQVAHSAALIEEQGGQANTSDLTEKLVTAVLLLLLYVHAYDRPDVTDGPQLDVQEVPAAERTALAQLQGATVLNVGWRVGAQLRAERAAARVPGAPTGQTKKPHPRDAHKRRSRVATRDELGNITGNVRGEQGRDWHYEERWIHEVYVNQRLLQDGLRPSTVRDLGT